MRGPVVALRPRPQRASDLFFLSNPTILGHLYPLCGQAGARERTLTAFPEGVDVTPFLEPTDVPMAGLNCMTISSTVAVVAPVDVM